MLPPFDSSLGSFNGSCRWFRLPVTLFQCVSPVGMQIFVVSND